MDATLGARIRALREQVGLQSQELAAHLGIDPSAMSNIERGKRDVKARELTLIAEALRVSPLALLDDTSLPARLPLAARAEPGSAVRTGDAYRRIVALAELQSVLDGAGLNARHDLGTVPSAHDQGWKPAAEQLAAWAHAKLDVPPTMGDDRFGELADAIEQKLGVDVIVEEYLNDPLSGAAITDRGFPLIFVNAQYPTPRCLFTLAHELGHLLAGHDGTIRLDQDLSGSDDQERLANAFAATFLMPAETIRSHIEEFGRGAESIVRMVHDFGVSFESLVFRLHNLRILDANGRDRLRNIGWRGLLQMAQAAEISDRLGPDTLARLMARISTTPARRAPLPLASRLLAGHRTGVVSIRPLAGLLHADPETLLDLVQNLSSHDADVLDGEPDGPPAVGHLEADLADDDASSMSPV